MFELGPLRIHWQLRFELRRPTPPFVRRWSERGSRHLWPAVGVRVHHFADDRPSVPTALIGWDWRGVRSGLEVRSRYAVLGVEKVMRHLPPPPDERYTGFDGDSFEALRQLLSL